MRNVRGFAIVSAVFLLVILTALGAFMVTLSSTQNITSAQDVQGARAYRAARAGIEWAAASLCNGGAPCAAPLTACPVWAPATIDGFGVDVICDVNTYNEGGADRHIFWVRSTATTGGAVGSLGYVERMVSTFIEF